MEHYIKSFASHSYNDRTVNGCSMSSIENKKVNHDFFSFSFKIWILLGMVQKLYFSSEAIFTVWIFKYIPLPSTLPLFVVPCCGLLHSERGVSWRRGWKLEQEERRCSHLLLRF